MEDAEEDAQNHWVFVEDAEEDAKNHSVFVEDAEIYKESKSYVISLFLLASSTKTQWF